PPPPPPSPYTTLFRSRPGIRIASFAVKKNRPRLALRTADEGAFRRFAPRSRRAKRPYTFIVSYLGPPGAVLPILFVIFAVSFSFPFFYTGNTKKRIPPRFSLEERAYFVKRVTRKNLRNRRKLFIIKAGMTKRLSAPVGAGGRS